MRPIMPGEHGINVPLDVVTHVRELVRRHGQTRACAELRVTPTTLDRVCSGIGLQRKTVERVVARLAELDGAHE